MRSTIRPLLIMLWWCSGLNGTRAQAGLEHVFDAPEGAQLVGVTPAADGSAYLSLARGGPHDMGSLARLMPDGQLYTLHAFGGTGDPVRSPPHGPLSFGRDGLLYGTTSAGGKFGYGVLFRLDDCNELQVLHDFTAEEGGTPRGPLLPAADGGFYVVTYGVYDPNPDSEIIGEPAWFVRTYGKVLYASQGGETRVLHDGLLTPEGGVMQASDGYLYGTTPEIPGGSHEPRVASGNIYRMRPDGSDFSSGLTIQPISFNPRGELVEGPDSYLYGVSDDIVYSDGPKLFRLPLGSVPFDYQEIARDGWARGGLGFGSDGNLYGSGHGFFRLTPSGLMTYIHEIDADTVQPTAAMRPHPQGGFYIASGDELLHMSQAGGMTLLHRFGYREGHALSELWQSRDGRIYGTTQSSGEHGSGTLFRFEEDNQLHTLLSWPNHAEHSWQSSALTRLTEAPDGTLYGLQTGDHSVLLSVSPHAELKTLHAFDPRQGPYPYFSVAPIPVSVGPDGAVYGVSSSFGGLPDGNAVNQSQLFRFDPTTAEYSVVARLEDRNVSALTSGTDGALYVISSATNTPQPSSALLRIALTGQVESLHEFRTDAVGHTPTGNLVAAADGGIYGFALGQTQARNVIYRWDSVHGLTIVRELPASAGNFSPRLSLAADGSMLLAQASEWPDGSTGSYMIDTCGQVIEVPGPSLGALMTDDSKLYRIAPIERSPYRGFRIATVEPR